MTISTETPSRRAALGVLASIPALALPAAALIVSTPAMATPATLAAIAQPTASAPTQEASSEGDLVSLGQRLEQLTRERETAETLQGDARARLENTTPKVRMRRLRSSKDESFAEIWDSLTIWEKRDPPMMTMEQRWGCLCQLFEIKDAPSYTTIKADAERSGYASAKERVEVDRR